MLPSILPNHSLNSCSNCKQWNVNSLDQPESLSTCTCMFMHAHAACMRTHALDTRMHTDHIHHAHAHTCTQTLHNTWYMNTPHTHACYMNSTCTHHITNTCTSIRVCTPHTCTHKHILHTQHAHNMSTLTHAHSTCMHTTCPHLHMHIQHACTQHVHTYTCPLNMHVNPHLQMHIQHTCTQHVHTMHCSPTLLYTHARSPQSCW